MNPPERPLSDKIQEIATAWFSPFEAGLSKNRRKLTSEQHAELFGPDIPMPPPLEIDDAAANPIHDHRPQSRPKHKVRSVLAILDQLDKETPNRRFKP